MNLPEVDLPCNAGRSQKHRLFIGTHTPKKINPDRVLLTRKATPHAEMSESWGKNRFGKAQNE